MAVDAATVPRLAKKARVRFDRHSGGWMIVWPERGLALNESAAAITRKLDGARALGAIADELAAETGGARDEVLADVIAFVAHLEERGLVET